MKAKNTISPAATEILFRIFGIWPNTSFVLLRRLFWIISIVFEQIGQYRYIVKHFHLMELFEIIIILSSAVAMTRFFIVLVVFWCKQRTFSKILTMMAIDWEKSSTKFSIFATYNAKLSERLVNMTVFLYLIAAILTGTKIFVKHMDSGNASNVSTRLLIVEMDLPFDTNQRFVYESVLIIQFFHLLLCSNVMGVFNALLINLILHIGGQIDILRESLIGIIPKKERDSSNHFTIKEIIKKHQKIITFSEHIEHLYSYITMVLFVSDILIICCLGSTIVASIGRPDVLKNIIRVLLFYFVMNMEAFVFCFAGEYLSAKSKSIGDAAYASLWYESDSRTNQIILFLIMRSQNQLTITVGKIMNLSLERFTSIIKTSGSYISVLLAMC